MRALLTVVGGLGVLGAVLWLTASPAGAVAPSAEAGADLAARWCAACHVVSPSGAGTDAAPSFAAIANQRSPNEIRNFLAKPHARPMRGFSLSTREIEDVTAYIASLQQKAEVK
ncbi:MAG TPA: cytochrome c [Magnetospirillum sp.]|jgi:mono/diheme cytochrome c family protein|nr:cytochrome c [Magnetospirillum sp.]